MPTIGASPGKPSARRASSRRTVPYDDASIPVGIDSTRAASTPTSRTSCSAIAPPVVTMRAVARRYSHRVFASPGTGTETCRVRTIAGGFGSSRHASAASQLSVELCVLTMS
jgi:hypothetical protein